MPIVDVTTEALATTHRALSEFLTGIEGMGAKATRRAEEATRECQAQLQQSEDDAAQSEELVAALAQEVERAEAVIQTTTHAIGQIEQRIVAIREGMARLDQQASSLDAQAGRLEQQLRSCDDERREQLQSQIGQLRRQASACRRQQSSLAGELNSAEGRRSSLQQELRAVQSQKAKAQSDLAAEKSRCQRLKDKAERLRRAFGRVEQDLQAYVTVARRVESSSSDSTRRGASAVQKSLALIEEYMGTSLAGGGGGYDATSGASQSPYMEASMNTPGEIEVIRQMEADGELAVEDEWPFTEPGSHDSQSRLAPPPATGMSCSTEVMACEPGEYHYGSDDGSAHAFGQLQLVAPANRHRDAAAQVAAGGANRRDDDEGGHLIAARFGGLSTAGNLFPQNRHLNRAGYKKLENLWAKLLDPGRKPRCQVFVDIHASSAEAGNREDAIYGSYTVIDETGRTITETFSFANESDATQAAWAAEERDLGL